MTIRLAGQFSPTRLMVGLHYLKYAFNESDQSVLDRFLENPYWQYFCGFEYFQHELPIDSSSMTKFRKRLGTGGAEKLFDQMIETAKRGKHLIRSHLKSDNRMSRNYLKGKEGDQINAVLCACGYNLRKLLAVSFLPQKIGELLGKLGAFLRDSFDRSSLKPCFSVN